jgi:guanylate kinase
VLINDDIQRTFGELTAIVTAERLRRSRAQPAIKEFVKLLLTE